MKTMFYALPEKLVNLYRESRRELLEYAKTSKNPEKERKAYLSENQAAINDIPQAKERNNNSLYSVRDGVAFIPITGMLTNEVDICAAWFGETVTTYPYIRAAVTEAEADPEIEALAFLVDSGGGYVNGVDQTAQAIIEAKKPTFAFTSNMAASAAYWLASQADQLISITDTGFFGSIGVAASYRLTDNSKVVTFTSTPAKKKRPDITTEEGQAVIIKEMDDLHEVFVSQIIKGRPHLTEEIINGTEAGIFKAADAKKIGLIDDIIPESQMMAYVKDKMNNPRKKRDKSAHVVENKVENKTEVNMNLKDDPAARIEHEAALKEKYEAGVNDTKKKYEGIVPYVKSETYFKNSVIRETIAEVLSGEATLSELKMAVRMIDAQAEKDKSIAAKVETEDLPDTPPGDINKVETQNKAAEEGLAAAARSAI